MKQKTLLFLMILLISVSCSTLSTKRPIQGDEGWDGVKTYAPILNSREFQSKDQTKVGFESPYFADDYILLSVDDYQELAALVQAGVLWNRKQFFDYLKKAQEEKAVREKGRR